MRWRDGFFFLVLEEAWFFFMEHFPFNFAESLKNSTCAGVGWVVGKSGVYVYQFSKK